MLCSWRDAFLQIYIYFLDRRCFTDLRFLAALLLFVLGLFKLVQFWLFDNLLLFHVVITCTVQLLVVEVFVNIRRMHWAEVDRLSITMNWADSPCVSVSILGALIMYTTLHHRVVLRWHAAARLILKAFRSSLVPIHIPSLLILDLLKRLMQRTRAVGTACPKRTSSSLIVTRHDRFATEIASVLMPIRHAHKVGELVPNLLTAHQ